MEPLMRHTENQDWITVVLLAGLLLLSVAKGLFYHRFMNFVVLPINSKYIFMYNKKDALLNGFNLCLSLFKLINFALFLYFANLFILKRPYDSPLSFYFGILGFLFVFVLLKSLVQLGNAEIFNIEKLASDIMFKKLSFLNHSSLVMFVANILISYVPIEPKGVLFVSLPLVLLINVVGWFTMLRNHQILIISKFFYFILYLCALEIAPLIIIGSYLKD